VIDDPKRSDQEAAREQLLRDLPPGQDPFIISKERLALLDHDTRNAVLEEQIFRQGMMRIAIACPIHDTRKCMQCIGGKPVTNPKVICSYCRGTGRVPQNAPMTFGCAHVARQDDLHPDGIVFTPKRYYVCKMCWSLIERKKFDFDREIMTLCWYCIEDEARRIVKIDPALLLDLGTPTT